MAGRPGRSGRRGKSIEDHLRDGTYRADRHDRQTPEFEVTEADRKRTLDGLAPEARRVASALLKQYDGWDSASLVTLRAFAMSCERLEALQAAGASAELYRELRANNTLLGSLGLEKPK